MFNVGVTDGAVYECDAVNTDKAFIKLFRVEEKTVEYSKRDWKYLWFKKINCKRINKKKILVRVIPKDRIKYIYREKGMVSV